MAVLSSVTTYLEPGRVAVSLLCYNLSRAREGGSSLSPVTTCLEPGRVAALSLLCCNLSVTWGSESSTSTQQQSGTKPGTAAVFLTCPLLGWVRVTVSRMGQHLDQHSVIFVSESSTNILASESSTNILASQTNSHFGQWEQHKYFGQPDQHSVILVSESSRKILASLGNTQSFEPATAAGRFWPARPTLSHFGQWEQQADFG